MERYLIDTKVVPDYFAAALPLKGLRFMDSVINAIPVLSVITQIELLCWKTDLEKEQKIKDFLADSEIIDLTPSVIEHCVKIRRNKKIKTPDAIIAATVLVHGYTLLTNNEKDFNNIEGLKLINPFKMV